MDSAGCVILADMDEATIQRILRQHLETDRLLGVRTVIMAAADAPVVPAAPFVAAPNPARPNPIPATPATPAAPAPAAAPAPRPVTSSPRRDSAAMASPASASTGLVPGNVLPLPGMLDDASRLAFLSELSALAQACTACPLCQARTHVVFGEGNPQARVMFIGEGPGQTEDETGRPFVGRAGEMLDSQIAAMGLKREAVYIANVVKCRPPDNRTPTPAEAAACYGFLHRQIAAIRPQVIVTLGLPAVRTLLQAAPNLTLGSVRGQWQSYTGLEPALPLMPTYHPAYLLRSYTKENRQKVWSDLQAVVARLKEIEPG